MNIISNCSFYIDREPYYPDFLVIESKLNIIIKIDEPYIGKTGEPIHYYFLNNCKKNSIDASRNDILCEKGYTIIRFAEIQIFKYPKQCIKFINTVIKEIKKLNNPLIIRNQFPYKIKKWSQEKAYYYAFIKFRSFYMKSDYYKLIKLNLKEIKNKIMAKLFK